MRFAFPLPVLALLLAGVICAEAAETNADQEKAVAAIMALGGKVGRATKAADSPYSTVNLGDTKMTDENIAPLEALPGIRSLSLRHGYKLTDAAVAHLQGLTKLEILDLWDFKISDAGLKGLAACTEIRELNLGGTAVTDGGMAQLKQFPRLELLNLQYTKVGDGGMAPLKDLPKLASLNLSLTQVTDNGLAAVGELKGLQSLYLPSAITDAGLAHLRGMTGLHVLGLRGTKVTDTGLANLSGLTELSSLDLVETKVTDEGVKKLNEALPKCRIQRK